MNRFPLYDDFFLWSYRGVRRRQFQPTPIPEATFAGLTGNPAESVTGGRLLFCPEVDRYRLWYSHVPDMSNDWGRVHTFAESDDAIAWREPECGAEIARTAPSVSVTRDPRDPAPERRYKAVYIDYQDIDNATGHLAFSPDGIAWTCATEYRFCSHPSDTMNNIYFNSVTEEYQIICRPNHGDRRIATVRSRDLLNWSDTELMMSPDVLDPPCSEYYGMTVFPQSGYFLGFLWIYLTDMEDVIDYKMAGKIDTVLAYSYDGNHWLKASNQAVIDRPMPPAYGSGGLYANSLVETRDGASWLICSGAPRIDHATGFKPAYPDSELPEIAVKQGRNANVFHRIRAEGFVGFESIGRAGRLTWKAFDLTGDNLTLNVTAPAGWVKCQLSKNPGTPYPGFSFEDSVPFVGDSTEHRPRWKHSGLEELIGRKIMVEIELNAGIVYSVGGDLSPHHGHRSQRSPGDVRIE